MVNKDKFGGRLGDYVVDCQICGHRTWFSQGRFLNIYTGRGGLFACKDCQDPIDFGIVPYKIPAEKPIRFASDNTQSANPNIAWQQTTYRPFDYDHFDPMSTSPQQNNEIYSTWDQSTGYLWQLDPINWEVQDKV